MLANIPNPEVNKLQKYFQGKSQFQRPLLTPCIADFSACMSKASPEGSSGDCIGTPLLLLGCINKPVPKWNGLASPHIGRLTFMTDNGLMTKNGLI